MCYFQGSPSFFLLKHLYLVITCMPLLLWWSYSIYVGIKKLNNFCNWCMRQTRFCVYKVKEDWLASFEHANIHLFMVSRINF